MSLLLFSCHVENCTENISSQITVLNTLQLGRMETMNKDAEGRSHCAEHYKLLCDEITSQGHRGLPRQLPPCPRNLTVSWFMNRDENNATVSTTQCFWTSFAVKPLSCELGRPSVDSHTLRWAKGIISLCCSQKKKLKVCHYTLDFSLLVKSKSWHETQTHSHYPWIFWALPFYHTVFLSRPRFLLYVILFAQLDRLS